jgi:hypothetical protein
VNQRWVVFIIVAGPVVLLIIGTLVELLRR